MTRMTTSLLALALLVPAASAATAPDRAKEKLEAMKKKLPEVVKKWGKHAAFHVEGAEQAELRFARLVSPTEAKLTVIVSGLRISPEPLTIYLRYYDGSWTSTRSESRWNDAPAKDNEYLYAVAAIRRLMLAIDELGEK